MSLTRALRRVVAEPGLAFERLGEYAFRLPLDEVRAWGLRNKEREITNQRELRVASLRRSGHHAVLDWIMRQLPGTVVHLNDLRPNANPYAQYWRGGVLGKGFGAEYRQRDLAAMDFYAGDEGRARLHADAQGRFAPKKVLVLNFEDCELARAFSARAERLHDLHVGRSGERLHVLVLRDPFNWLASRLKIGFLDIRGTDKRTMMDLWLDYAREFVGETNEVPGPKVCISYNRWFADESYRQQLAGELGIAYSESGLGDVAQQAGGSSFDGTEFQGRAQEMKVLERWQAFANDPTFRALCSDPVVHAYSERIFGVIPGTERLLGD